MVVLKLLCFIRLADDEGGAVLSLLSDYSKYVAQEA